VHRRIHASFRVVEPGPKNRQPTDFIVVSPDYLPVLSRHTAVSADILMLSMDSSSFELQ
jgi:hypothetical protein